MKKVEPYKQTTCPPHRWVPLDKLFVQCQKCGEVGKASIETPQPRSEL